MHVPVLISFNPCTKFEMPSLTCSKDMMGTKNLKKLGHDANHTHFRVDCHPTVNT